MYITATEEEPAQGLRGPQANYSRRAGPTTGDRVRLADTNLWLRVEDGHVGYGDEPL